MFIGNYMPEGFQTSCTFDYLSKTYSNISHVACMYIFGFMVPVGIIVFCYIGIVHAIMGHHKEMMKSAERMGASTSQADREKRQEVQITKVAAISISTFLLSWTPYAAVAVLGMIFHHDEKMVTPYMAELPVMLAKASASWNPVIYAISHPRFRAEIDKHFPWLLCCCPTTASRTGGRSTATVSRTMSTKSEMDSVAESTIEMSHNASNMTVSTIGTDQGANPAGANAPQCT